MRTSIAKLEGTYKIDIFMFIIHIYILELILFFFLNSFLNINVWDLTRRTKPHKKKADAIGLLAKEKREREKRNGS